MWILLAPADDDLTVRADVADLVLRDVSRRQGFAHDGGAGDLVTGQQAVARVDLRQFLGIGDVPQHARADARGWPVTRGVRVV